MESLDDKTLQLLELELSRLKEEGVKSLSFSTQILTGGKSNETSKSEVLQNVGTEKHKNFIGGGTSAVKRILLPSGDKTSRYKWLKNRVLSCEECKKHVRPGKQLVFGVGNLEADIFFCGEAPGAEEEQEGEPFVGRAGQLLTKIISAMNLARSDVYIANIMNWRPEMPSATGNRPPTADEMEFCLPYLLAQIEIVQPKVIVALGATAAKGLLGNNSFKTMREVRGGWKIFAGIPLMITFHPSYLLRNNNNATKRVVWEDMLSVMKKLNLPISSKQLNYFL